MSARKLRSLASHFASLQDPRLDLLAVRENQPTLFAEIERRDAAAVEKDYAGASHCGTEEKSHGRQELRACGVRTDWARLRERVKWPGLQSVVVVVRDRTVGKRNSCAKHSYLRSRKLSAKRFLEVVRGHWGIENSLPWVLDVVFAEDSSRVRKDHGPENLGQLRRMAISMLKAEPRKGSIQVKRRVAGWDDNFMEKILLNFRGN